MMKSLLARAALALALALALAGAVLGASPARAQIDEPAAERLMRQSGLWEQLGATGAGTRAGIETAARHRLTVLTEGELARLLAAIDAAFAPERLRGAVRKALAERVAPVHLPALAAWLGSDLGQRITALEVAAARPDRDSERAIREGIARLGAASEPRRRLLENLVESTRAPEFTAGMAINVAVAVQRGVASVKPDQPVAPVAALRQALEAQRAQMLEAYRGMSQALFAEIYRPLADEELARYLEFLRSEAGQRFIDATMRAIDSALGEAAERLGTRLPGTAAPGPTT